MTTAEKECLAQDDIRLFHRGACHVFAAALQARFPEEQYLLKRVERTMDLEPERAFHVVATQNQFIVDASGIKREEDYRKWLLNRPCKSRFNPPEQPKVELYDTSREELMREAYRDDLQAGESINCFRLFTGAAFVAQACLRAKALIDYWPDKYTVSILSPMQ